MKDYEYFNKVKQKKHSKNLAMGLYKILEVNNNENNIAKYIKILRKMPNNAKILWPYRCWPVASGELGMPRMTPTTFGQISAAPLLFCPIPSLFSLLERHINAVCTAISPLK